MMHVFTKQLTKLHFHSNGAQWAQLFRLTALQELCLTVVVPFEWAVAPPPTTYTTLPHLRCLKLQQSTADLSPLLLRCAMPAVTSLTVTDCRISGGADLAALPMMAPALRELRLTWLTLAEAPPLVLPHLRVADLSRSSLPGTFWQQTPHAWPALQQLLLDGDAQAVSLDVVSRPHPCSGPCGLSDASPHTKDRHSEPAHLTQVHDFDAEALLLVLHIAA